MSKPFSPEDPALAALVDRLLVRYQPFLSPKALAELRQTALFLAANHPSLAELTEALERVSSSDPSAVPSPPGGVSGVVAKRGRRALGGTGTGNRG